jgi:hypothetical protein
MSSSHNHYQDGKSLDKFFRLTLNNGRVISAKERGQQIKGERPISGYKKVEHQEQKHRMKTNN